MANTKVLDRAIQRWAQDTDIKKYKKAFAAGMFTAVAAIAVDHATTTEIAKAAEKIESGGSR